MSHSLNTHQVNILKVRVHKMTRTCLSLRSAGARDKNVTQKQVCIISDLVLRDYNEPSGSHNDFVTGYRALYEYHNKMTRIFLCKRLCYFSYLFDSQLVYYCCNKVNGHKCKTS